MPNKNKKFKSPIISEKNLETVPEMDGRVKLIFDEKIGLIDHRAVVYAKQSEIDNLIAQKQSMSEEEIKQMRINVIQQLTLFILKDNISKNTTQDDFNNYMDDLLIYRYSCN